MTSGGNNSVGAVFSLKTAGLDENGLQMFLINRGKRLFLHGLIQHKRSRYGQIEILVIKPIDPATENPDSKINYHIRRGILVNAAREQMGAMNNAEKGDTQAIRLLGKIRYRKNFETARRNILYDCEIDEKILHRLETYIESGSTIRLKPGEEIYLEAMTLMNGMRRKYGRSKTIKFFCRVQDHFGGIFQLLGFEVA